LPVPRVIAFSGLKEETVMRQESRVTKPESGHWTDAYPELGRGPVSFEDCVSEEFYEKELEHVFRKTWLYVILPEKFAALEHLVPEWSIEDGHARYVKRVNSSMQEIQAFYDAVFPHAEAAVAYLNEFDYQKPLPEDAANLRNLLITVSLAVKLWKQPRVKHSANTIQTRLS
jgi:hypothetical protein